MAFLSIRVPAFRDNIEDSVGRVVKQIAQMMASEASRDLATGVCSPVDYGGGTFTFAPAIPLFNLNCLGLTPPLRLQ